MSASGRRTGTSAAALATALTLVLALTATAAVFRGRSGPGTDRAAPDLPANTAHVVRRDLVETARARGTLGYGEAAPVLVRATGTVTWLPAAGTVVRRGQALLRVDDRPVTLLYGPLPMYRDLGLPAPATGDTGTAQPGTTRNGTTGTGTGTGATGTGTGTGATGGDGTATGAGTGNAAGSTGTGTTGTGTPPAPLRGRDVLQLETNLRDLGYRGFTVDDRFTAQTAGAVRRWQRDLGLPQTGTVAAGDVVYAAGPVRVARTLVRIGAQAGGQPLTGTGTTRLVTVEVPAPDADWAVPGARVSVGLPGGRQVAGVVGDVAGATGQSGRGTGSGTDGGSGAPGATADGAGSAGSDGTGTGADSADSAGGGSAGSTGGQGGTVTVTVTVPDQAALQGLQSAPVEVVHVLRERRGVLAVPVAALLALAEGGYGVELVQGGRSRVVAVRTGMFADGLVEISGAVTVGDVVGMPG